MTSYAQINDEIADKLDTHAKRLYTVKQVLSALLYFFENEEFNNSIVELYCIGTLLLEYLNKTNNMFEELQKEMGTLL